MIRSHILGFPRSGAQRELTTALQSHWRGECSAMALKEVAREVRRCNWALQRDAGLDLVSVGDFALCDHVLNHIQMFGCEPARFGFTEQETDLARHFAMAHGGDESARNGQGGARQPLALAGWFDTGYQYRVPEFQARTRFRLAAHRLVSEVAEAQAQGHAVKPVLLGPVSFLWLGRTTDEGFDRLDLLEALLPRYVELLLLLKARGIEWVQVDEPVLGLKLPVAWRRAVERAFHHLQAAHIKLMLATYFGPLEENISLVCKLPIDALHIDAVSAPQELRLILDWMPIEMELSVGIVNSRTTVPGDIPELLNTLRVVRDRHPGKLWVAPSCSLLHAPRSRMDSGNNNSSDGRDEFVLAVDRLEELAELKRAWNVEQVATAS